MAPHRVSPADPPEPSNPAAAATGVSAPPDSALAPRKVRRTAVLSWAMWDWGSAAYNAVITTFVFSVWLTSTAFIDPEIVSAADGAAEGSPAMIALDAAKALHSRWLGIGLAVAGVLIALLAPVVGSRADGSGHRKRSLGVYTGLVVAVSAAMFLVRPTEDALTGNLLVGIALLGIGHVFFELASVNYNAMLSQISSPANVGRVSGFGWGMGYIGGIVLLALILVGFIAPDVGWFGTTSDNGMDIRAAVLLSAVWFGVFAIPVLTTVPEVPSSVTPVQGTLADAYRRLFSDIAGLWNTSRDTLRFLIASAVFRDGLAGVFTFGAVIAAGTFGFEDQQVIIFAIGANVVAGLTTIASGWFDDRFGPKTVIITALVGLIVAGLALFFLHAGSQSVFWTFGLMLSAFVGPAQTASRTLLARVIPPGREAEVFGLYATTGRAASFLSPAAFAMLIWIGGSQYWGILGILLVLGLGLALLIPVRLGSRPDSA